MDDELANDVAESALSAILQALNVLMEVGVERHSISCSVALMNMDGIDVQVQISITPNKADWIEPDDTAVFNVFPFGNTTIN